MKKQTISLIALLVASSGQADTILRESGMQQAPGTATVDVRGSGTRNLFAINQEHSDGSMTRVMNVDPEGRVFFTLRHRDTGTRFVMQDQRSGELTTSGKLVSADSNLGNANDIAFITQSTDAAGKPGGQIGRVSESAMAAFIAKASGAASVSVPAEGLNRRIAAPSPATSIAELKNRYGSFAPVTLSNSNFTVSMPSGNARTSWLAEGEVEVDFVASTFNPSTLASYCNNARGGWQSTVTVEVVRVDTNGTVTVVGSGEATGSSVSVGMPGRVSGTIAFADSINGRGNYRLQARGIEMLTAGGACQNADYERQALAVRSTLR